MTLSEITKGDTIWMLYDAEIDRTFYYQSKEEALRNAFSWEWVHELKVVNVTKVSDETTQRS